MCSFRRKRKCLALAHLIIYTFIFIYIFTTERNRSRGFEVFFRNCALVCGLFACAWEPEWMWMWRCCCCCKLMCERVRVCLVKRFWASVSMYLWFFADLKWIGIENAQCAWYKRKWNGVQTVPSEKEIIRFFFHGVHVNTFANADTNFVNAKRFIVPAFFFCFALLIFFLFVVFHRLAKELFNLDVSRAMHAHDAIRLYAFSSLLLHKFENFLNHWCQFDSGCPHARQHTTIIINMNWKIFISTRNFRHRNINLSKKILLWK